MKILIDTNILLAIAPKRSSERWLYEMLRVGELTLILSNEIIEEYEEKLVWFYSAYFAEIVLDELLNFTQNRTNRSFLQMAIN